MVSSHRQRMANAESVDPSGYADCHIDEIEQTGEPLGLQKQDVEWRVRKQALLRARREESSVNAPSRPSGQNSHSDWPKDTLTHAATGPRCKHCDVQLVPLTPAKNCCSPGGGCVCQAAPACAHYVGVRPSHDLALPFAPFILLFFWRSSSPFAEPFLSTCPSTYRIEKMFVVLLASLLAVFSACGFRDAVLFSLHGGLLVWFMVAELSYMVIVVISGPMWFLFTNDTTAEGTVGRGFCCHCVHQGQGSTTCDRILLWSCNPCRTRTLAARGKKMMWVEAQPPQLLVGMLMVMLLLPLMFITLTRPGYWDEIK